MDIAPPYTGGTSPSATANLKPRNRINSQDLRITTGNPKGPLKFLSTATYIWTSKIQTVPRTGSNLRLGHTG